jgi:hypothetical protein
MAPPVELITQNYKDFSKTAYSGLVVISGQTAHFFWMVIQKNSSGTLFGLRVVWNGPKRT